MFQEVYISAINRLRGHEVVRLKYDATIDTVGQRIFERGDNLVTVLNNEFDAGIVPGEFDIIVTSRTTYL